MLFVEYAACIVNSTLLVQPWVRVEAAVAIVPFPRRPQRDAWQ